MVDGARHESEPGGRVVVAVPRAHFVLASVGEEPGHHLNDALALCGVIRTLHLEDSDVHDVVIERCPVGACEEELCLPGGAVQAVPRWFRAGHRLVQANHLFADGEAEGREGLVPNVFWTGEWWAEVLWRFRDDAKARLDEDHFGSVEVTRRL
ncbi:hypothetical protein PV04_10702 [Phialophora macrospora]|uniref:Uncharacterized protein n=1 Tax=Phialophora macrospora TaxID=1851006 RepID=A0A0D2FRD6_9EURO|nr:hypothetical protein PV04_10702 [Phialophora macrospora]